MIERFLRRLTVRQRIGAGFLALVLLLALPVPLLVANRNFLVDRLQQVTEVEGSVERSLLRASALVASSRVNLARYLQDHLPTPTESLRDLGTAYQLLENAQALTTSQDQKSAVEILKGRLNDNRSLISEIVTAREAGEGQSYVRRVYDAYGLGNEISQRIEQIVQNSEERVRAANEQVLAETRNSVIVMFVTYTTMILAGLILAIVVTRSITRPVTTLRSGAESFQQGQLDIAIPVVGTDELSLLAQTFNEMAAQLRDMIAGLEQRVAERTHELERRSAQLEASAEVGSAASSILDADRLIAQVVELIRERFGLYYVGLFLVDDNQEWAVLRAGTGEAGQAMLARQHRIRVGEGMIGWSVANARARVALDVQSTGEDAVRLATAELPETRSEAALPLRTRGQVIGALTVQDSRPGAFDQDTITVLQTMADQVAVALDNAHLFAESQEALQAERRAYGELSHEAWSQLLGARADWGYRYTQRSVNPVAGDWRPEMWRAAETGRSVQRSGVGETTLAIPLKVREDVIGALCFRKGEDGGRWTSEEAGMLEALTEELGQALESARLYHETQRRAAQERVTREITDNIRAAVSVEDAIQRAVREMGRVLGASEMVVRIGTERDLPSGQGGNGHE